MIDEPRKDPVRTRFAPSPTGYLHVGGARTALFNWLLARQSGGSFVLRIEDTDRTRHVADSVPKILDDLRWLGLSWDEGPEVGGAFGPYFQSERLGLYNEHLDRLLATGHAYYALETPEQLAALREQAKTQDAHRKYRRPDPLPTVEQGLAARADGQPVTVRFKMPERDITVEDRILGQVRIAREELEDFVIQKNDGWPTYHFACVVDDEFMGITHVLRGQEHLMNTPKHVAMQEALGFATPVYAHLPIIFNMNGSKMSKRDKEKALAQGLQPPEIEVHDFRLAGYLPEALLNFISLIGWSPGDDREHFTLDETVGLFRIDRIGTGNGKFDRDKLLSFNTRWAAALDDGRRLAALKDYSATSASPMTAADDATLEHLLRASAGFRTFRDVESKSSFLFVDDHQIDYDPKAVQKVLAKNDGAGYDMLAQLLEKLPADSDWNAASIDRCLIRLRESKDVGLGAVAQPLRVAVTGTTISPPIHDTLELLGRSRTINRIRRTLALRVEEGAA